MKRLIPEKVISSGLIIVQTTVDSQAVAEMLVKRVVDERVAACAALSPPCRSTYHWQGKIENANEWQVTFKTRADLFDRVAAVIRSIHPYQVPEIVALPIVCADEAYSDWIRSETAD